jgi:TATA-box binding protein (TBP) (component of TFIID and TFIIIB)
MDSLFEDQQQINPKLHISTMSTICKIFKIGNKSINIENIYNFLPVSYDDVLSINFKNNCRTIDEKYKKKEKKKKTKKIVKKVNNFFNQITLLMAVDENRKINTKLFTNGSVQMTGSKSILDNFKILNKLIECLKTTYIVDGEEKKLVENPELLEISDFKISMINTNFGIGSEINREELLKIIKQNDLPNIKAKLKPDIHAAINIELLVQDYIVTILVFKTGNIIITGGKNSVHINTAYEYITKLIEDNKSKIIKNYVDEDLLSSINFDIQLC